ncbi:GyrI-like domain-containing protein [Reichenbachiella carrageenanivorans]|uniref:GyrI-like domain-containing protein n=1 Tax=Reichenbachiella carrageenanivorans TaxID=2979869 RepID=A0ABY6CWW5_9BACT|nr:GyrI-like domain-containing protein [Reichenbachiella carrageenanivorans]UXX78417.1 GyrI-like domain-containing protein [Reichenbachiella carrageenanivorans]
MQTPRIVDMASEQLVGLSVEMSYTNNMTGWLWGQFMPRRHEIKNLVSQDKYSLQVFSADFDWYTADPDTQFVKWAAMAVTHSTEVPSGMATLTLEGGQYAVFVHRGLASEFLITLHYILETWMPTSGYVPDTSRPQFEILGEKYRRDDPKSEEEIWFPIKKKTI